jgi:stage II sporulation protein D
MRPTGRGILVIITVILMFFSVLLQLSGKNEEDSQNKTPEEKKSDDIIIETETKELYISLYNHWNKRLETLTLEDYLIGVVAGEMPASYGMEALKAQAVAARTLAVMNRIVKAAGFHVIDLES